MSADPKGKDQIMKLIEHCRIENNWGSSSFFDNTMREIVFMDYLLTQRRLIVEYNIATKRHCIWFKPNFYKEYAREEISVLSIHQLMMTSSLHQRIHILEMLCSSKNKANPNTRGMFLTNSLIM